MLAVNLAQLLAEKFVKFTCAAKFMIKQRIKSSLFASRCRAFLAF
ncbi:hypothetical protein CSUNSWCD_1736 [Campylobacter showae CSUNSWCD]|uniref:Uncharacterized protein n=1 Tax=Campylobacter showae CSUNSWCD TaxID=1244083 RepID=M5ISE6_9BACT|nr:hypothetical protein CSUNSWCD_1736 [Campylobacter showae CSUNSWCD]